jgi:hypothetical protein
MDGGCRRLAGRGGGVGADRHHRRFRQLWARVTDRLIAQGRGADLILITRKPEKLAHRAAQGCTVRYGDFDLPETLAEAVAGRTGCC